MLGVSMYVKHCKFSNNKQLELMKVILVVSEKVSVVEVQQEKLQFLVF